MNPEQSHQLATLVRDSLLALTGRDLLEGLDGSGDVAAALAEAPFALVAHDTCKDPVFVYANRTGLGLFERTWDDFTSMPSRLSSEPAGSSERARMLRRARNKGYVDGYRGVRIASSGTRFEIHDAMLWNLVDADGHHHGQAACIPRWTVLPDVPTQASPR